MTVLDTFKKRHNEIRKKLMSIELPEDGSATQLCWNVGSNLNVSGPTIKNYLTGEIKDGFLAEAIHGEFKRLKYCR